MTPTRRARPSAWACLLALMVGGACAHTSNRPAVSVEATDTACTPARTSLTAGKTTFAVHNTGKQVTELYVYGAGDKIEGEVENVGPGTTRTMVVDLAAGRYTLACKPGQKGAGIRTELTVSG